MNTTKHNITNTAEPIKPGYKKTSIRIIPEDWEEMRLEQVSKIIMGVSPNSENYNFEGQGKFLIQGNADIRNRKSAPRQYTSEITKECQVGDILMSVRAPVGEIAKSIHNACIGRGVCAIRNNKKADGEFLFYYLLYTEVLWSRFKQGSTFESVNSTDIRNFTIQIPPIQEQKAIADCLSTWDKAIEKLSALIASKKEQKKGLMQGLFSGELKVENGELVKVEDEKLWLKGWKEVRLGDLFDYKNGKSLENEIIENGEYNLITLNSIDINGELKKNHHRLNFNDNSLVKNDVIMILSDVAHGNFLGLSAIIPDNSFVLNQRVGRLRLMTEDNVFFIRLVVNFNQRYFKRMGQGSSQQNLSKGDILKFKFNIPSIKEQNAIAEILQTADKEIELLEQKLASFKMQKKGLMQVLLTGTKRLV